MKGVEQIEVMLAERLGLDASTHGFAALRRAVERRVEELGLSGVEEYAETLARDRGEPAALADWLAVPETWFFRDGEPFEYLEQWARKRRGSTSAFRALSAGCSTGEEAYSIAAILRLAGYGPDEAVVTGVDISHRALAVARGGSYRRRVLRRSVEGRHSRFFETAADGTVHVADELKRMVQFEHGNLAGCDPAFARVNHDAIFCRNVLIYQNADGRNRILDNLAGCLLDGGLLVVGHAEPLRVPRDRFHAVGPLRAFAFSAGAEQRAEEVAMKAPAAAPEKRPLAKIEWRPAYPPAAPNGDGLAEARSLANRGLLREASAICQRAIESGKPAPAAYCLLGTIALAEGRTGEAETLFSKAVYLDANQPEALAQLARIFEGRGDRRSARIYRRRAKRAGNAEAGA